jgi:acetyl esterase/lipase
MAKKAGLIALASAAAALLADTPSPGRKLTTLQRMEEGHLAAVHEARMRLAKERKAQPQPGVFTDYRAVLHVHAEDSDHTKGTREEVLRAAKATGVSVVMFTDHRGPKPDTWTGMRDGVLFFAGAEDDHLLRFPSADGDLRFLSHLEETPNARSEGFQGMEIYNRHTDEKDERAFEKYFRAAMTDPAKWADLARLEGLYPDEVFGAGTDYWPSLFAMWDKEIAAHPFTGIAANDSHKNQTYLGVTFDPYEVSFRNVSTHILAIGLTPEALRESLRKGRAYVAHDWLCDPTGFSFSAINNNGVYNVGDRAPMLARTRLSALSPVKANLRILHNGAIAAQATGNQIEFTPTEAGAYRLEAWLDIDGEQRPWIYANPIYLEAINGRGITLPPSTVADTVEVTNGIAYAAGRDEDADKHKLDLYAPKGKTMWPVLVFLHGGSWRSGDRSNYPALANRFVGEGFGVVVPSYRLMPGAPHPAQVEDAAAAVDWVIRNIAGHGGDRRHIYLIGHSAGGHLSAWVATDPRFAGHLKGVIAMSGVYDVSEIAAFKSDPAGASPIRRIAPGAPPFLITYCENDYPYLPAQAREFEQALKAKGVSAELLYVAGKNHITEIVDVCKQDDPATAALLQFIARHR